MNCGNCTHFNKLGDRWGQCRRYPPTVHIVTNANGDTDWVNERPSVSSDDQCGEFKMVGD